MAKTPYLIELKPGVFRDDESLNEVKTPLPRPNMAVSNAQLTVNAKKKKLTRHSRQFLRSFSSEILCSNNAQIYKTVSLFKLLSSLVRIQHK